jgi:hypothetical protein
MMTADASKNFQQSSCETVMRRTQARGRHVCDHCGGRFNLVTHRWWGNKFCKKVCKDAYLREIVLDRDAIRRWFGFTRARSVTLLDLLDIQELMFSACVRNVMTFATLPCHLAQEMRRPRVRSTR